MKKLNKRSVFSVVLALMLVFTVGFYSSAEHTTAWFTAFSDESKEFTMDNIDITYDPGIENGTAEMTFDASTKFADADERAKMFEHACKFFTVTITNSGERDALVFIDIADVSKAVTTDKGVRYYIYEYDAYNNIKYNADQVTELVPGVFEDAEGKRVIESDGTYFRTEKMIADILTEKIGNRQDEIAAMSGEEQLDFLNQEASSLVELKKGQTKSFCCAFWVEYDYFKDITPVDGVRTLECNVNVEVNAVQADHYPVATSAAA
ncbi:MAG: hypothetical protein IJ261_05755 [Clostridia bacterium]|nr:hypothetical protein [Clostridia bacterium]